LEETESFIIVINRTFEITVAFTRYATLDYCPSKTWPQPNRLIQILDRATEIAKGTA
jgi:hypothetical protein